MGVQRGYDPTKFQFEVVNEMTGKMVFTPDNTGFEGIREFTNTQGYLVHPFTAAQQHAAMEKGWILTGTVRAEEGGAFLIADFDRVNRRYDIFVFRNGHGGTSVRLIDKLIPALLGEEADLGHGEPQFREFRMRFDPRSATASLDVDGRTVLSGYKGHSEYVNPYGLVFGITRYLGERGVSTFGGARFEILP